MEDIAIVRGATRLSPALVLVFRAIVRVQGSLKGFKFTMVMQSYVFTEINVTTCLFTARVFQSGKC